MATTMTAHAKAAEDKADKIEDLDMACNKAAEQIWRTGLILSNKYTGDDELAEVVDKVQDCALIVTEKLKAKFPEQLEDDEISDDAAIGSKRAFQRLLAEGWFKTVKPEYGAFLAEDASVFERMDSRGSEDGAGIGAKLFRKLRMSTKWKSLSEKERSVVFRSILQINAYCRVASDVDLEDV